MLQSVVLEYGILGNSDNYKFVRCGFQLNSNVNVGSHIFLVKLLQIY